MSAVFSTATRERTYIEACGAGRAESAPPQAPHAGGAAAPRRLSCAACVNIPGLKLDFDEHALAWRATRHRGVAWLPLHLGDAPAGDPRAPVEGVVLIRMDPGCGYPAHTHVGVEDVLVLRGGYRDERGEHRAGDYVRYAAGSSHAPVALGAPERAIDASNPACVLFAIARAGIRAADDASE